MAGICEVTCEASGGRCGALTASGVICDAGYLAGGSGFCLPGGGCCMPSQPICSVDSDCGAGMVCTAGVCQATCEAAGGQCGALTASGVNCPAGYVSDGGAGACAIGGGCCMPTQVACKGNSDCGAGEICTGGFCVAKACRLDTDCAAGETCVAGTCTKQQVVCAAGETMCGGVCVDVTASPANCGGCGDVCTSGEACVQGRCTVAQCRTDSDCTATKHCINWVCQ